MKRFGVFLERQIISTIDFLFSTPFTKFSVPGIIFTGGAFYYMLNTCEWRGNRRRSKEAISFYKRILTHTPPSVMTPHTRERTEEHIRRLKKYRRETWFPSFNPPPVPKPFLD
jgi:hypothetical protein